MFSSLAVTQSSSINRSMARGGVADVLLAHCYAVRGGFSVAGRKGTRRERKRRGKREKGAPLGAFMDWCD
jgi:hypothetical protein